VCKSTGQNSGLRQGGVRWQVEGASRDGAGGGKAMGGREGPRGREKKKRKKKKRAYSTTDSLVVPHRSAEVA